MLLFPFVQIVQNPLLSLPYGLAGPVAQWMMFLQFPVYGLMMTRIIRSRGFWVALNVIVAIHGTGVGIAFLLQHFQNPSLRLW